MPLVRIDAPSSLSQARLMAVADSVHDSLVEVANVPHADRFQAISTHGFDRLIMDRAFLGIDRSPEALIVTVTFRRGRTDDQKRALYRRIVERASASADMRPQDIMVVLMENGLADWSFGQGEAQYAPVASTR